jgi:phage baseplate assembly protein W
VAEFNFKSVGIKNDQQPITGSTLPIGIKTPLQLGKSGEGIFAMHTSLADQMADNLRNLITTNHGERLGLYDFGANLRSLTLDFTSLEDFDSEAIIRIRNAVTKYMPFVNLKTFESTIDRFNNQVVGKINIKITYNIPQLSVTDRQVAVTLYVT